LKKKNILRPSLRRSMKNLKLLKNKEMKLRLFMLSNKKNCLQSKQKWKSLLLISMKLNNSMRSTSKPSKLLRLKQKKQLLSINKSKKNVRRLKSN